MSQQLFNDLVTLTSPAHAGRNAGSDEPNISAQFLYERFNQLGLQTQYQRFSFKSGFSSQAFGHNVVAKLPCNTERCGKAIVVSAHYDHLGTKGSKIYAGANDNASGTAALLAVAQQLKNAKRFYPVILLATDAEEKGLHGAKHYASQINKQEYALNINLDMLALNQKSTLYVMHSRTAKPYVDVLTRLQADDFKLKLASSPQRMRRLVGTERVDWLKASDHYAFHRAGLPYLYFGMGEDKNHHSVKDTIEQIDFEKYQHVVNFISDFMVALLDCPLDCTS
ncbi:M28 family peptidase [Pseudoalteromonas byunsanensis]|uniref:Peptidase n=1 Tax=Pseudoalteromonas byunsanensis TaxID=327939 RepID=A0A1S1NB35_9GAMM|nr:M28 family peptidase [Pseudoalteromonas byunsanensis]OHU95919.1 peptidase [Pseudoalteromonas byunsanensis]